MNAEEPIWYLPGPENKPTGPFTTRQVTQRLVTRRITATTLCWKEGMSDWKPLAEIEPFASTIRVANAPVAQAQPVSAGLRSRLLQLIVAAVCISLLTAGVWHYMSQHAAITEAERQIARGNYGGARRTVRDIVNSYLPPHAEKASYLSTTAKILDYVSEAVEFRDDEFGREIRALEELILADKKWLQRAREDLAHVLEIVPGDVADSLKRKIAIVAELEKLKVVDGKQTAPTIFEEDGKRPSEPQLSLLDAKAVTQLLKWDQSSANDLVKFVSQGPGGPEGPGFERLRKIKRWANPQTRGPLADGLLGRADKHCEKDQFEPAERLLTIAVDINPDVMRDVREKRFDLVRKRLQRLRSKDANEVRKALAALEQLPADSSSEKTEKAELYFLAAKQLRRSHMQPRTSDMLEKALELNPHLLDSEENFVGWLGFELRPSREKLKRCQQFLDDYPESSHRAQVLLAIVNDAVAIINPSWGDGFIRDSVREPKDADAYFTAAVSAAQELAAKFADDAPSVSEAVFQFCRHYVSEDQPKNRDPQALPTALNICKDLLESTGPHASLREEIEQTRTHWKRIRYGTLPEDKIPDAERVADALVIVELKTGDDVNDLHERSESIHVARVANECTRENFNTDQEQRLQQWVSDGGVLWVNNNVLTFFGIEYDEYRTGYGEYGPLGPGFGGGYDDDESPGMGYPSGMGDLSGMGYPPEMGEFPGRRYSSGMGFDEGEPYPDLAGNTGPCSAAVIDCPILADDHRVQLLPPRHSSTINLVAPNAIPLLSKEKNAYWSLVPVDKGWVSNVKAVALDQFDGGLFWLNFRRFCLGELPVDPGSVQVSPGFRNSLPTTITSAKELKHTLSELGKQQVMWIQLEAGAVEKEEVTEIRHWVEQGGVLWLDTDLGRQFGFRLKEAENGQVNGHAQVVQRHPVVQGVPPMVRVEFTLSPSAMLLTYSKTDIPADTRILLGRTQRSSPSRVESPLGIQREGEGYIVFRPRKFSRVVGVGPSSFSGEKMEEDLRAWSVNVAGK
ncbi:MAG: GYF domain-containing protein [Pirellulaceae bacterium]